MNWIKKISYLTIFLSVISSCDSFEDDALPSNEKELSLAGDISALPNTSLFIDLKKTINTSSAVRFQINTLPNRGDVSISSNAIMHYVPNKDFLSGNDFLSLDLINGGGQTIDTDSIFISMASSADSLPCFNGALSDNYFTSVNEPLWIDPIANDGYCVDQISGAIMNILDDPENGKLEKVELFTYSYIPDHNFIGTDEFMYELILIDDIGVEHYSLAQINVEVKEHQDTLAWLCESLMQPVLYSLVEPREDFYFFDPFIQDPFCGIIEYDLDIISVDNGSAIITDAGQIKYFTTSEATDKIIYDIILDDRTKRSWIDIEFIEDGTTCNAILEAADDLYELTFTGDSIGTQEMPYLINIADNDIHCFDYSLKIINPPTIGVATIHQSSNGNGIPLLSYYSEEEFAGEFTTKLDYEICNNEKCDEATVTLKLIK